jgi:hypothetical protein
VVYTPEAQWSHEVPIASTDGRDWVEIGLL